MLNEGNSCMYGGLYIVHSNSSMETEILSLCTSIGDNYITITDLNNVSVVLIHYSEYLVHNIEFYTFLNFHLNGATSMQFDYDDDYSVKYNGNTLSVLLLNTTKPIYALMKYSNLFKLRKIHYINICCDALYDITFAGWMRTSCINITVFYSSHASNIKGRQYNQETIPWHGRVARDAFIQSILINMYDCNLVAALVWNIFINLNSEYSGSTDDEPNATHSYNLPFAVLPVHLDFSYPDFIKKKKIRKQHQFGG